MIGFEYQGVTVFQALTNQGRGQAKVGANRYAHIAALDIKANGIIGIVRHREGFNLEITDVELGAIGKDIPMEVVLAGLLKKCLNRSPVAVERNAVIPHEHVESTDVVRMFVGDANSIDVRDIDIDLLKAVDNFFPTEAGVDED